MRCVATGYCCEKLRQPSVPHTSQPTIQRANWMNTVHLLSMPSASSLALLALFRPFLDPLCHSSALPGDGPGSVTSSALLGSLWVSRAASALTMPLPRSDVLDEEWQNVNGKGKRVSCARHITLFAHLFFRSEDVILLWFFFPFSSFSSLLLSRHLFAETYTLSPSFLLPLLLLLSAFALLCLPNLRFQTPTTFTFLVSIPLF